MFGDSATSSSLSASHQYTSPGTYTVNHSATNAGGTSWLNRTAYITVTAPTLTASIRDSADQTAITNANVSLYDWAAATTTYANASTGSAFWPGLSYGNSYAIRATAPGYRSYAQNYTHPGGGATMTVLMVREDPLVANFTGTPTSGTAPLTVTFNDTSSGGTPTLWYWTFGDGTTNSTPNPVHTYATVGNYTVDLEVANAAGDTNKTVNGYIQVLTSAGVSPIANFTGTPTSGTAPLTVQFNDTSTGSPTSWSWNFGDGETATDQNATHTYTAAGTYDVSLTAMNAGGSDTETKMGYVVVTASMSNQATNIQGINVTQFGIPRPNFIENVANAQRSLGYTAETKYYNQTNNMRNYIQNRLPDDAIFFFDGHGVEGGGGITVNDDTNENYYASGGPSYNLDEISSFSNMRLAIFLGCYTGLTSPSNGNLVNVIADKGGKCAMGWSNEIWWDLSPIYGQEFWSNMDGSTTPYYAHDMAIDAVKNTIACTNYHNNDPSDYSEFCNFEQMYSSGTDCNMPLQNVNSNKIAQMYSLQKSAEIGKNNVRPTEQSLIQKKMAITSFNPDMNITFKHMIQQSYADLYTFQGSDSSGFVVNDVTGRVQSAVWSEPVSKSQKESINLNQGSAIAESFAKEKYPELWNISDSRGIKLTRNEVLDRGVDRQLCFTWAGILFGSPNATGQRAEVRDGNEVSVTVSPYTGHIIDYNEIYLPSVFADKSLVNLTPTVMEDQAREFALAEFRSIGVNANQSGSIRSLGLRTIIDAENIPHMTWAFEIDRTGKWGIERAFVNVDARDGYIVWSQPYAG